MEVRDLKARKVSESLFEALGPGAYELHVLRGPTHAAAEICFFPEKCSGKIVFFP